MVMWGMMKWWYTAGWHQCLKRIISRIDATSDFFSISLLVRTLFAPFRQISAGSVRGPLAVQMRAFFDRLISRIVGMVVRLMMVVIGSVVIACNALIGLLFLLFWPLVPILPLVGAGLYMLGWVPWSN